MKPVIMSCSKLLLLIVLVLAGCSARVFHPLVSRETPVSRDSALIVMGTNWVELYNDTDKDRDKKLYSADLLKDKTSVNKVLEDQNGTVLEKPLHYLSRFQFQFETPAEEEHAFIRFGKDTREYEEIAIHEFVPGSVQLVNIAIEQHHFLRDRHAKEDNFRWRKHWLNYEESYGNWDLQAGKVTYLGHLTMYFKTRRFIYGMLMPEELVDQTKLVAIVIEDRFDEVKQQLKREKPWFPIDEIINQAKPAKWVYSEELFAEFQGSPDAEPNGKKQGIKRDKKKFFF